MAFLPNTYNVVAAQGSEWSSSFQLQNSDGTPMDISGKTFEMVVRRAVTDSGPPIVSVNNSAVTTYGTITVTVSNASLLVVLTSAGTATMIHGGGNYTLWMNPGLPDQTAVVVGTFYCNPVVNP